MACLAEDNLSDVSHISQSLGMNLPLNFAWSLTPRTPEAAYRVQRCSPRNELPGCRPACPVLRTLAKRVTIELELINLANELER